MHAKFSMVYIHLTSSRVHLAETWKSVELQIKGMKADQYFKTNVYAGNIFKTTKTYFPIIYWKYLIKPLCDICVFQVRSILRSLNTVHYFYLRMLNRFKLPS